MEEENENGSTWEVRHSASARARAKTIDCNGENDEAVSLQVLIPCFGAKRPFANRLHKLLDKKI